MIAVLAMNDAGCIGRAGSLPWHKPEDLAFFKRTTLGGTVVMGRRTWDGLPRKPLPGRDNVVLTRRPDGLAEAGAIAASLDTLDEVLAGRRRPVYLIGGAQTYALLWSRVDELLLTRVDEEVADGDTFFPRELLEAFELVGSEELSASCRVERWQRRTRGAIG